MIRETLYTGIGAAALAADFVTSPSKQQTWLKKAERRGVKLAETGQKQLTGLNKTVESGVDAVYGRALELIGFGEAKATQAKKTATTTARRVRRATPRVSVASRTTSGSRARKATGTARARQTTISVVNPEPARAQQAS
ncbi:MAG TPA: hypothetical protein VG245_01520 [Candidatus Dormibacteraeota bacterium]|nr:hypothetical protein [Candidatus Dormibacteraeota bacterium]